MSAAAGAAATRQRISVPPPVAALGGWLVPGGGYVLIGQRARGVTVGVTILLLFAMGLLIGGLRVVDPPEVPASRAFAAAMEKPWFVGQVLAGPVTLVTAWVGSESRQAERGNRNTFDKLVQEGKYYYVSHARSNEIGTLYTAVAGMLNLLTIIDAAYRAGRAEGDAS